jgi:hypothetical protein
MAVITNMIAINVISQTNCQVCSDSEPCLNLPASPPSISYGPGVWVVLSAVSVITCSPHLLKEKRCTFSYVILLRFQIFAAVTFASSALLFALRAYVSPPIQPISRGGAHYPFPLASSFGTRIRASSRPQPFCVGSTSYSSY